MKLSKSTCKPHDNKERQIITRNSAIADNRVTCLEASQGHQTWYHSIC